MPRYCLEVAYKGTAYAGFQTQQNANTVQDELEKALAVLYRQPWSLTGSSRTDAGVHAKQNFFHADAPFEVVKRHLYNVNAILPPDIVVKNIFSVAPNFHCRFLATFRRYRYFISIGKNPFTQQVAWFYPYALDLELLNAAAAAIMQFSDFTSFSKRNTQVHTKVCKVERSHWYLENDMLVYEVVANRFLRGMVRGLVATQLQAGRGKITIDELNQIVAAKDASKADFSAPAHGLFLEEVGFPENTFTAV
ncbi:MAG: tRNA pseudouridine(38-40) synthase TruA [Bacteroidetes bacterium]|nr:MAG: tRNA pseudouridine(38-40) synthase TruA [Bacteroidota bacterium]